MAEWENEKRREDWDNLDFIQRETIIDVLSKNFPIEFCNEINKEIQEDQDWWKTKDTWGIELRAFLNKAAFPKDNLPKGNWEYYWVSAVEKSVERKLEKEN
jgi:hypothetical protein